MRRSRLVVLGLALALATAACGSRTTTAQKLEALGSGRNGGGGGQGNENLTGAEGGATGTDSGVAAGANGSGGSGGATGGASAAGKSGAASGSAGKGGFSGDNGGNTDIGVTGNSITASNVSILTGPVPGLFAGAFNGTDAFFQYQNSQGGVYGRQLKVLPRDDQFDCGQNKSLTDSDIPKVFAFVGSFSLFDNCGAQSLGAHAD